MLTMKDVVREGHPALRQVADPMTFPITKDERQLAEDMLTFLANSQDEELAEKYELRPGVGIAAPQLAISKQLIALLIPGEYEDDEPILNQVMLNPRIISHSVEGLCLKEGEGCLSVDRDIPGYVPRHARITVRYYDLDGNQHKERFKGYPAIVIQHEIDHLNGILFFDRINQEDPFALDDVTSTL